MADIAFTASLACQKGARSSESWAHVFHEDTATITVLAQLRVPWIELHDEIMSESVFQKQHVKSDYLRPFETFAKHFMSAVACWKQEAMAQEKSKRLKLSSISTICSFASTYNLHPYCSYN